MFYYCSKLIGGNGLSYNSSYVDKTYACIDKTGQKGYLTDITVGKIYYLAVYSADDQSLTFYDYDEAIV
jgi:hypothetical protein